MIITIGEVVTDHFPEYRRIGGAPLNFACHMKKFGEEVCLITRVGNDADGNDIRKMIRDHGLSIKRVQIDQTHPTGRVNVTLDPQGVPSFDIAEDAAYDWIDLSPSITGEIPAAARLIYFGSLIQRSPHGFEHVRSFLERRPSSARCFCDINFRPPHISRDVIEHSLHCADILKLNEEELSIIGSVLGASGTATDIVRHLMANYAVELVAVTLGEAGSFIVHEQKRHDAPRPEMKVIVDTVGAGDAFSAVLALGYLRGASLDRMLQLATHFAARICQSPGAIPEGEAPYAYVKRNLEDF